MPVDEWQMVRFARYLANGVSSYDTVSGYISTIKRMHELAGVKYPENTHLLKLELMSIRRELAHLLKKAPPITPELLVKIHRKVMPVFGQDVTVYAAIVVGFTLFPKEK